MGRVVGLQCLGPEGMLRIEIGGLLLEIGTSGGGCLVVGSGGFAELRVMIAAEGVDLARMLGGHGFERLAMLDAGALELGDERILFLGKSIALGVRGLHVALVLGCEIVNPGAVLGGEGIKGFLVGNAQGVLGFPVAGIHPGERPLMILLALGEAGEDFLLFQLRLRFLSVEQGDGF
jgi:hypothetical protein